MSNKLIRQTIRTILLESRGSLGFFVILKKWVEVAAEHGEFDRQVSIQAPDRLPGYQVAEQVLLKLKNRTHAAKVFDGLTTEVQEFVLKHWKTKEYFTEMIQGVSIGTVKEFARPNWMGLKSGDSHADGGYVNIEGLGTGTVNGFLTMRGWDYSFSRDTTSDLEKRNTWKKIMLKDVNDTGDSTLVHEFQHWFQESVLYQHSSDMHLSPRTPKGEKKAPKHTLVLNRPKPIMQFQLEDFIQGVDWSKPIESNGIEFYPVESLDALKASLCPDPEAAYLCLWNKKGKMVDSFDPTTLALASKQSSPQAMKIFITKIVKDFLKIKDLTEEDIDRLVAMVRGERTDEGHLSRYTNNLYYPIKLILGNKYKYPDGYSSHHHDIRNQAKDDRKSGGTFKAPTNKLLKSLQQSCQMYVFIKSAFDKKTGILKPGKVPKKATASVFEKAYYVGFSRSRQTNNWRANPHHAHHHSRPTGRPQRSYMNERNPTERFGAEWNERWVEFDAELANYSQSEIRKAMTLSYQQFPKMIVLGQQDKASKFMSDRVKDRLRRRRMSKTLEVEGNAEQVERLVYRMIELLIETTENYSYDHWHDNVQNLRHPNTPYTKQQFTEWATDAGRTEAPSRTIEYFRWILAKAAGEDV